MVSECFGDLVILGYSVGDCCNVVGVWVWMLISMVVCVVVV